MRAGRKGTTSEVPGQEGSGGEGRRSVQTRCLPGQPLCVWQRDLFIQVERFTFLCFMALGRVTTASAIKYLSTQSLLEREASSEIFFNTLINPGIMYSVHKDVLSSELSQGLYLGAGGIAVNKAEVIFVLMVFAF